MWLSKKIEKDPEAKKTLKELSKLIREYSDATKLTKDWFSGIDRIFKPKPFLYLITIIITAALFFYTNFYTKVDLKFFDELINASLLISVPIFVLGITLSTAAKSLDKESRFAIEYLQDSCKIVPFTYLAFLTVIIGFLYYLVKDAECKFPCIVFYGLCEFSYVIFASIAVGGTLWCLWSLVYIIAETTNCMSPEYSTKAASTYAARKLISIFLKDAYTSVWMKKHSDLLEQEINKTENIQQDYIRVIAGDDLAENRCEIKMPIKTGFHFGYRDYNLKKIKQIDKLLKGNDAKLHLVPHVFDSEVLRLAVCKKDCSKLINKIKKSQLCKFTKHKYKDTERNTETEYYLKFRSSLLKSVEVGDIAQFREYLDSIKSIFDAIRITRKHSSVLKKDKPDYDKFRYLQLYSKSVEWLLKDDIDDEVLYHFFETLEDAIQEQVESDIRNGDWFVLDTFKLILPYTYKQFVKHKGKPVWQERARIGRFYAYANGILAQYESKIKPEEKKQIRFIIHNGILHWLKAAIENKDDELAKDLCSAARRLVFLKDKINFDEGELTAYHLILYGKLLSDFLHGNAKIGFDIFQLLLFEEHRINERSLDFNYQQLVDFYIKELRTDMRDYLRDFYTTDWEMRPLDGGGHGTPQPFFGDYDLDYAFIYLSLWSITEEEKKKIRPVEYWSYGLKEKIEKFKGQAYNLHIYDFESQKDLLVKWLDDCTELYERQEAKRIANAELDDKRKTEYGNGFWDGYKETNTFLKFCLKYEYYTGDEKASSKSRFKLPKSVFIKDSRQGLEFAKGEGSEIAHDYDKKLLSDIIKSEPQETASDIEAALDTAIKWLIGQGANETDGVIVYCGDIYIDGKLSKNKNYTPSWREKREKYFTGYYKNYPVKRIRSQECEKVTALNLKGWKGIHIRPEVVKDAAFGDLAIREWTDDEISKFISEGKIKEEDRNNVRGRCLVEYELFWKLDKDSLPEQMTISMAKETEDENVNDEAERPPMAPPS